MKNINQNHIPTKMPGIVSRILDSDNPQQTEAVLVIPGKGEVKVLNEVGARIWSLIDGQISIREIILIICSEFDVAEDIAETDTLSFLSALVQRGMIEII
jgi:hypothetical protein